MGLQVNVKVKIHVYIDNYVRVFLCDHNRLIFKFKFIFTLTFTSAFFFAVITWIPFMQEKGNLVCYLPNKPNKQLYAKVVPGSCLIF